MTAPFLRMERGFVDEDATDESFRGLTRRECASCAACEGSGHILSAADSEGATPCLVAESLRWDGADAKAGPATAPQQGQGAHHANADKTGSTLDELMRSRSSSTGDLIGGNTLPGRGAAVAGGNLISGDTLATLLGRGAAIAASSVRAAAFVSTCMV